VNSTAPNFMQYGFPYPNNLIQAFIGGSQLHGAKIDGTDDTDWYGVFIEPPEKMIGLDRDEHFVFTTGGKEGGNGPQAKGNPSALHFVFVAEQFSTKWWQTIRENSNGFASRQHLTPFIKFADDQMDRLLGRKGQKNIHRAALEEAHGYDTKYAMHVIRLYLEAKEYMEDGKITLPNPRVELLVAIRNGKYKLSEIEATGKELQAETYAAQQKSPLPNAANHEAVTQLITGVYLDFWNSQKS
jgi:hypothetical protein